MASIAEPAARWWALFACEPAGFLQLFPALIETGGSLLVGGATARRSGTLCSQVKTGPGPRTGFLFSRLAMPLGSARVFLANRVTSPPHTAKKQSSCGRVAHSSIECGCTTVFTRPNTSLLKGSTGTEWGVTMKITTMRALLAGTASALAVGAAGGTAVAGGFDVREQSALFQGMSFAGAAAGGTSLSSMFWNPAAAGYVGPGISMESNYSLIIPRVDVSVDTIDGGLGPIPAGLTGLDTTVDVGRDAVVPASYAAYRLSSNLVLAVSMNSQFGLGTKPDNQDWVGQNIGRSSKLFSVNATPTVAYEVMPGLQIGAGVQVQYIDLMRFKAAAGPPGVGVPSSVLEGDDIGFGYTLGVNFSPAPGTSIGVGFRSSISHELDGSIDVVGAPAGVLSAPLHADLDLPEKLTASLRQDLAPGLRAHATVEWTNWSRLGVIPAVLDGNFITGNPLLPVIPAGQPIANLDFQWEDGWYFALGGEYDYSDALTLRAGVGYEISPIREATQRLVQLPDNDRVWLSGGASYKVGDLFGLLKDATVDLAYTHVFVEDGNFERSPSGVTGGGFPVIAGDVEASVDIISVGLRSKW